MKVGRLVGLIQWQSIFTEVSFGCREQQFKGREGRVEKILRKRGCHWGLGTIQVDRCLSHIAPSCVRPVRLIMSRVIVIVQLAAERITVFKSHQQPPGSVYFVILLPVYEMVKKTMKAPLDNWLLLKRRLAGVPFNMGFFSLVTFGTFVSLAIVTI